MKPTDLNPEYKKWFVTICLVATLGFNLTHLFDQGTEVDQGSEGTADLASELGKGDGAKPEEAKPKESNAMDGYLKLESGTSIPLSITKRGEDAVNVTIVDGYKDP